jgi:hypothetical protein
MSAGTREAPWAVRLSVQLYRRLLIAYPEGFRRQYGPHMVQVFRDCCREASHAEGAVGLGRYWLIAFGDLMVSALAERRREEVHMSRTFWVRLGSLAGIVGGVTAALFAALDLVLAVFQLMDENSPLGLAIFPVQVATGRAVPALWLLYLLALIGLQARGVNRAGVLGWVGISAAVLGAVLIGLGTGLDAVIMYSQADGCRTPLNCNYYDPDNYLLMGFLAGFSGSVILAIGMILYGIAALRRRFLSRRNGLPLVVGVMALLGIAASVIAMFASSGTDYTGMEKLAIMLAAVALASAVVWALLGAAMWPRGDEEAIVQAAA